MRGSDTYLEEIKKLSEISEYHHGLSFGHIVQYLTGSGRYQQWPRPDVLPFDSQTAKLFARVIQHGTQPYPLPQEALHNCRDHADNAQCAKPWNQILLLCGYPSPNWVAGIGSAFEISPELWRRHFEFLSFDGGIRQFEDTKLPSAACNVIQLRVCSIGSRGSSHRRDQAHVKFLRTKAKISMDEYRRNLSEGRSWQAGDSVIRRFVVHDEEYFTMEQLITIHVSCHKTLNGDSRKKWLAIICVDHGSDLESSPRGPWFDDSISEYRRFLPVPNYGFADLQTMPIFNYEERESASSSLPKGLPHSLLRSNIPTTNSKSIQDDPFFALHDVIKFYITSEAQFLSFLDEQDLKDSEQGSEDSSIMDTRSLMNLRNNQRMLEDHSQQLSYLLGVIKVRGSESWPKCHDNGCEEAARSLQRDVEYLLDRAECIRLRSERTITLAMGVASIEDARRGIKLNETVLKITIIAALYLPLTYTASLFGMNIRELGQGHESVWWYVVISTPIFFLSTAFLYYGTAVIRYMKRLLHRSALSRYM